MKQSNRGMNSKFTRTLLSACIAGCALGASQAYAGATVNFGEDKSVSIGLGLRTSYTSTEKGAPNGTSRSSDFNVDSARLYLNASLNKYIKGTFNTEKDSSGNVKVLDAYAQFEFMPEFNVWAGRMLPPSDRSNLDGPYYLSSWEYPGVVSNYPAIFAGRDDGVLAWGKLAGNKFVYSAGVFQGRNRVGANSGAVTSANTSNQSSSMLYAGRVAYSFWDAEPAPAYYTGSTYYGSADILTVGFATQYQKDGVGNNVTKDDYKAYNVDVLMEKKLSAGVLTLEGAYYKYKFSTAAAAVDVGSGAVGSIQPGKAGLVGAAFLFPQKVGWGKFQPFARYQKFDADGALADTKRNDIGLNYIIDGSNAKISTTYRTNQVGAAAKTNTYIVGLQLQF